MKEALPHSLDRSVLNLHSDCSRRAFAGRLAKAFLGVGCGAWASHALGCSVDTVGKGGTASKVIYLYMSGGMSHLDTLDPKSNPQVKGPVDVIVEPKSGISVSEYLPRMSRLMHRTAVVRGMQSNQGAHERGRYYAWTAYNKRGTIQHPAMGAWAVHLAGTLNPNLPGYIRIGGDSRHPGGGFMDAKCAPLPIGNPERGLQNSRLPKHVDEHLFKDRLRMVNRFNQNFQERYDFRDVRAYAAAYDDAIKLMQSSDLAAFDLSQETEATQKAYGEDAFGKGCMLARRLIESDVRFVEVGLGGWDTHQDNFTRVPQRAEILDRGLSALIHDLAARGLLDETLIVLATEFGRTPTINQNQGRDHYPKAFSCLLAGGGIRGGMVYGRTDANGGNVVENPVSVPDFNATIAHALGLPQQTIVHAPSGRPFTVADKGQPITAVFA
jgi:hypothetical protein